MLNRPLDRIHTVFATAYIGFAVIGLLFCILGLTRPDRELIDVGLVFMFIGGPIGLFHWYAARGARAGTQWGRNMSRVFGALVLIGFPIGTLVGVYVLMQTGARWASGSAASSSPFTPG
jgi:hypothetical protein